MELSTCFLIIRLWFYFVYLNVLCVICQVLVYGVICLLSVRYMFEGGTSFGYMNGVYHLLCYVLFDDKYKYML